MALELPRQHWTSPMIVKEPKAMTGAKGNEVPLCVQGYRSNGRGGHALHQDNRLESRSKHYWAALRRQPVMTLPRETLSVLEQVHRGHINHVIRLLIAKNQNYNLWTEYGLQRYHLFLRRQ